MQAIGSGSDGYWASVGKASVGSAAAAGVIGAFGASGVGAVPAAIWAAPGGLAAGVIGEHFERQGLGSVTAHLAASAVVAAPALGVALLARPSHPVLAGAAVLVAVGAAGAGALGALWN